VSDSDLLQSGNQIQAIKLYRELTGVGLAEAKDAVDRLADPGHDSRRLL